MLYLLHLGFKVDNDVTAQCYPITTQKSTNRTLLQKKTYKTKTYITYFKVLQQFLCQVSWFN